MLCTLLLRVLDLFPVCPNLSYVFHLHIAENVRMTAEQFVGDVPRHFLEIKCASFLRELAMKDHLQQQIAQFLRHLVIVMSLDGVNEFINFFDRVKAQRHVVLLAVPRATGRRAQADHNSEQIVYGRALLF